MGSSARRDQLVRLLRRGNLTTVDQLARELDVSRRTVMRDIALLRERGFIINGDGGRGGGVMMNPTSVLVTAQLTADEVVALILSVAMVRASPWLPFAGCAEDALTKIEAALPRERVRELRRLMHRILVGAPAPPGEISLATPVDKSLLIAFERAFTHRRALGLDYVDGVGHLTTRVIEPQALLIRAPAWYIIAWDIVKDAARLFRMDRISCATVLEGRKFGARPLKFVLGVCPDAKPQNQGATTSSTLPSRNRV